MVVVLSFPYYDRNFEVNLLAELHGMLFDLGIIGIALLWISHIGQRHADIRRWREEITDFKDWNSEEAARRVAGNIRRLCRAGVSAIDFSHCFLKKVDLRGLMLQGSDLSGANLSQADLSGAFLLETDAEYAEFDRANLCRVKFLGAKLYYSSIVKCALHGADFRACDLSMAKLDSSEFIAADLRGVEGLGLEQIARVRSLYLAQLDEALEKKVREVYPHLFLPPPDLERLLREDFPHFLAEDPIILRGRIRANPFYMTLSLGDEFSNDPDYHDQERAHLVLGMANYEADLVPLIVLQYVGDQPAVNRKRSSSREAVPNPGHAGDGYGRP